MFSLVPFDSTKYAVDRFDPFRDLGRWEKQFFGGMRPEFKMDIMDKGDVYVLEAELPGFDKKDIGIEIEGDYLTIHAERSSEKEEKDENGKYIHCERSYGSCSRSLHIGNVKEEEIRASYENGVLKLTLPKKDAGKPSSRRLEIN